MAGARPFSGSKWSSSQARAGPQLPDAQDMPGGCAGAGALSNPRLGFRSCPPHILAPCSGPTLPAPCARSSAVAWAHLAAHVCGSPAWSPEREQLRAGLRVFSSGPGHPHSPGTAQGFRPCLQKGGMGAQTCAHRGAGGPQRGSCDGRVSIPRVGPVSCEATSPSASGRLV